MRTRLLLGLFAGALALSALALTASAASIAPGLKARTLTIHLASNARGVSPIEGLALDGTRAAYMRGVPEASCGLGSRVYRWNLATGRTSLISGRKTCAQSAMSTGAGIFQIALDKTHSSWLLNSGTNTESWETLFAPGTSSGTDRVLATSDRGQSSGMTCCFGSWIGGLVSDGSRLTYARWSTDASGKVTVSGLWRWRISDSKPTKIAEGSGAVVAASADAGRTALLHTDGSVAVYGLEGGLLKTITGAAPTWCAPSGPSEARDPSEGIALTGDLVAVLAGAHPCAGHADAIKVYDRKSGALLHTWPVGGHSWEFDAYKGLAVYGAGTRLKVLDLNTGKSTVVAKRSYTIEGARLDSAGLLYYFNGLWSPRNGHDGQLVFVPFKTVAAKLGH